MITASPSAILLEEIGSIGELEALAPEWAALWARCPGATPFQSPHWILPWLRNLYKGGEIWAIVLRCGERLAGIAPLFVHGHCGNPAIRQVSFLGAGISDYLDVLIEPEFRDSGARAILRRLWERRSRWDICDLQELRPGSPLLTAEAPAGWNRAVSDCSVCPVLALPGNMATLRERLPHKFRTDLRRAGNGVRKAGDCTFETASEDTLPEYLDALFRLHSARWEIRHEPGMVSTPELRDFHRRVASEFERSGHLRVHGMRRRGSIVAVVYSFVCGETAYAYLGGFDPALSKLSPGSVLMDFSIERAVLEGFRDYDFLRDEEEYKFQWGAVGRRNRRILAWHSASVLPSPAFPEEEAYEH